MDIVLLLALAAHTVAFVIAWGYYGIMGRIVMPALSRALAVPDQARALAAIERRALPLVLLSVAMFVVTGGYLLVVNPQYGGLGSFRSGWAALMLLKHLVVVALVVSGVVFDMLVRWLADDPDDAARRTTMHRAHWTAEIATGLGALVVLLTVAAQLS